MGYIIDENQIPKGFEELTFQNMPEDGEVVNILRYGKVETMRFDKEYMAFNPPCNNPRLKGGYYLGIKLQEGITHFKRLS